MYELNRKLKNLTAYDPIEGSYAIRLDANESPYNLSDEIKAKLCKKISQLDFNRYPDPMAKDAVNAFAKFYAISPENVTGGNGSDEIISIIESCFFEKGDKILSLEYDFSMYRFYADLYELENIVMQKNPDLSVDIDKVIEKCNSEKVRAVIFSNPCNPTSLGISKKDVLKLIKNVSCLVIADEAYMDFWNESVIDKVNEFDNLIVLKTCSKAIGLAGIRMGFAVSNVTITNALRAAKSPYNTDSISQLVAQTVFGEQDYLKNECENIRKGTKMLYEGICELAEKYPEILEKPPVPSTNFVFFASNFCDLIFEKLQEKSIAIRNFRKYLRICSGTFDENAALLEAFEDICKEIL